MFRASPTSDISAPLKPKPNWPLIIGSVMTLLILVLAIYGPALAPQDPREQKLIIQVGDKWLIPPYPAFTPGYPLGSDNLGRDLFSWLLWSVRPTLILVVVVATLRMILGLLIGIGAGWSDRRAGRFFDGLITSALAVPTLLAALIVITAVGFRVGVWAFVIGLAITGWAETAQLVREQTRTIRSQDAVEAAIALGASGGQILFLHIVPQVMPMIWMLLAFEISNTLVTTAGLGFLGYYLGGAVFTEVSDFVYQRISGMPELGQMLATAWMVLDEPWAMVAAGTLVFAIVLAFNLIGEGLQQRLAHHLGGSRAVYIRLAGDVLPWFDERISQPVSAVIQRRSFRALAALLLIVALGGGVAWWRAAHTPAATPTPEVVATGAPGVQEASRLPTPGNHVYANEGGDPWQTRWLNVTGPLTPTVQWTFEATGFTGGPVIDVNGVIYAAAKDGTVYALDGAGNVQWQTAVTAQPVGSPALSPDGALYVADKDGLNAISAQGETLWRFMPGDGKPVTSGPVVGLDGTIYYKTLSSLWALAPDGTLRWQSSITESAATTPPRLSPDGQAVFWENFAFNVADGSPYAWDDILTLNEPLRQVLVGADGNLYHRYDVRMLRVAPVETAWNDAMAFDGAQYGVYSGLDAGVIPDGRPWFASPIHFGLGFRWFTEDGTLDGMLKVIDARKMFLAGIDRQDTAFVCSDFYGAVAECVAFAPGSNLPLWRMRLNGVKLIAGVALAEGRLYVATADGRLFAIGEATVSAPAAAETAITEKLLTPGVHLWATERGNPWGTMWSNTVGPQQMETAWVFEAEEGLSGGPVVAADGTLYVAGTGQGRLYALNAAGEALWQTDLVTSAVGAPALDARGDVYVVDMSGGLTAFTPEGQQLWRWLPENVGRGYIGPIVAPDGIAYYGFTRSGKIMIQAVSTDGTGLWESAFPFTPNRYPPALSPSGDWLFWENSILSAHDGGAVPDPLGDAGPASAYFTGANGIAYARIEKSLVPLIETKADVTSSGQRLQWLFAEEGRQQLDLSRDSGVTPDGVGWVSSNLNWGSGTHAIWGRVDREAYSEVLGDARVLDIYRPIVMAVDRNATLYLCGDQGAHCCALSPTEATPMWLFTFTEGERATGMALAAGRLYIATSSGRLLALGK